jgi:molybdate transport system regulatory protein
MLMGQRGQLSIRIDLAEGLRIGPGKVALLEAVAETGSISAAGRKLRMSYKRAWDLVEQLNRGFGTRLVAASPGGAGGGGAHLTEAGSALVAHYRHIERAAMQAAREDLFALDQMTGPR